MLGIVDSGIVRPKIEFLATTEVLVSSTIQIA